MRRNSSRSGRNGVGKAPVIEALATSPWQPSQCLRLARPWLVGVGPAHFNGIGIKWNGAIDGALCRLAEESPTADVLRNVPGWVVENTHHPLPSHNSRSSSFHSSIVTRPPSTAPPFPPFPLRSIVSSPPPSLPPPLSLPLQSNWNRIKLI